MGGGIIFKVFFIYQGENMKKAFFAIVAALAVVVSFASCGGGKGDAALAGTYKVESIGDTDVASMESLMGISFDYSLTLNADGTGKMDMMGQSTDLKWDASAKTITAEGDTQPYTVKDGKLVMSIGGEDMVFVKK